MRPSFPFLKAVSFFSFLFFVFLSHAQEQKNNASPYFVVLSGEEEKASLPLESTHVDAEISGVIADVSVKQTYTNMGKSPLEAIYVFPASTRAAVYNVKMKVGERIIVAKIEEKKKAREMYEEAKEEGKTTSLLEEKQPNVFKMNVANIMPGDTVEVKLCYTELLIPTDQVYEFVYPTVVGPRYVSQNEMETGTADDWVKNPYLKAGEEPLSELDIQVKLNTGIPIQDIRCQTHPNTIDYKAPSKASLVLDEPEGGNRDFLMQYKLAGNQIETGVLLHENPEGENFFLAMMQPPSGLASGEVPPREYVFIVDVSGSMRGFPLGVSKKLMMELFKGLSNNDLFNIVSFAAGSSVFNEKSLPATQENINQAIGFMESMQGGGGTELLGALQTAMNFNQREGYSRSFVILTDGYVSVERETFDYIRNNLGTANFFSFGIGSSVNRYIIEGMAHVGYGEPFVALNKQDASRKAQKFKKYISQPVLTDINCSFQNFDAYDVLPEKIPDLFAERPIIITGKYRGKPRGEMKMTGLKGKSSVTKSIAMEAGNHSNQALKYLWAREKIRLLSDYVYVEPRNSKNDPDSASNKLQKEITGLGLKYNLLTQFTSFIAVDSMISNKKADISTIKQPSPMPQGVSNHAIRGFSSFHTQTAQEEEEGAVFFVVESMPEFPGGEKALKEFIKQSIHYPEKAKEQEIEGRVFVSFLIDKKGNITEVKVIKGVHPLLDAEAIRVIKSMPKWKPGSQRGNSVPVRYQMPVVFELEEDNTQK